MSDRIDTKDLPPELTKELKGVRTGDRYTMRDLAMCYISHHGHASLDEIMVYIFAIRNRITSRGYMYQLIHRLRSDGLVQSAEKATPHNVVYRLTPAGEEKALPYLMPDTGEIA